ncbi:MAG TPA: hypothetical protein VG147_16510 [Solirubrobacteraceae bacterium]|nr:hypothetical protein [Solirubrobacteraceae bacterium]
MQEDWRIVARHDDRSTGTKLDRPERIPREKIETAILRQLTGIYRDGPLIHDALAAAQQQTQRERPALDERRHAIATEIASIERSTERYFEAFEQGRFSPERCEQRVTRLHDRLEDLRAQQAELADDGADEAAHAPTAADLAATADQLEGVIAQGEPEQTKALLRILIAELRVNGRHDIQPTYRIITPDHAATAGVCATSGKVDLIGVLSNHDLQGSLARLSKKLAVVRANGGPRRRPVACRQRPRRPGWVLKAVVQVLVDRGEPMRAKDIHAAVEASLGSPVAWSSVKAALAANVSGSSRRFVRIARGRYTLA